MKNKNTHICRSAANLGLNIVIIIVVQSSVKKKNTKKNNNQKINICGTIAVYVFTYTYQYYSPIAKRVKMVKK